MSGFSSAWLALREPADHASRDEALAGLVATAFADRPVLRVLDLGCGTGSNLRALAPRLPDQQDWRLVDHDPALLAAAAGSLASWADEAEQTAGGLVLRKGRKRIAVAFQAADLARGLAAILDRPADLVTAAALFDLVSEAWLRGFAGHLAARSLPLYTVLTYDGRDAFEPPDSDDATILAAFHRHQARDKGFGPSAGREAGAVLARLLGASGYAVATAPSPWVLGPGDAPLVAALTQGIALAAQEAGISPDLAGSWAARRATASRAVVGHVDLFARPGAPAQSRGTMR